MGPGPLSLLALALAHLAFLPLRGSTSSPRPLTGPRTLRSRSHAHTSSRLLQHLSIDKRLFCSFVPFFNLPTLPNAAARDSFIALDHIQHHRSARRLAHPLDRPPSNASRRSYIRPSAPSLPSLKPPRPWPTTIPTPRSLPPRTREDSTRHTQQSTMTHPSHHRLSPAGRCGSQHSADGEASQGQAETNCVRFESSAGHGSARGMLCLQTRANWTA